MTISKLLQSFRSAFVNVGFGYALIAIVLAANSALAQSRHVLRNQAIELSLDIQEGPTGSISLTGIRDIVANKQWLSQPTQLFELRRDLAANGPVWPSDTGFSVDSVQQSENAQLTVQARTRDGSFSIDLDVQMEPGSGLALISGFILNHAQDWFGPFLVGDQQSGAVPVFPADAELATVRPTSQHEETLVSGFDGILYSTQEDNDGPWSAPQPLQSPSRAIRDFFPPGAPLAAVRRNDHQSDVFVIGTDGQLYTVFRLDNASWHPPIVLSHGGIGEFMASGSVSAISVHEQTDPPTTDEARVNEVDVFAIAQATGQVLLSREVNDGPFTEPAPINPAQAKVDRAAHLATVKRNEQQQDLFVIDPQGRLLTSFNNNGSGALWSDFIPLSSGGTTLTPGSRLAAVRGPGDDEHVFIVGQAPGSNVGIGCIYETHEANDGPWSALTAITQPDARLTPGSPITAVRRTGSEIDVLAPLQDGRIGLITRQANGAWTTFGVLPASRNVSANATLGAMLRKSSQLDVFSIDRASGRIWTAADGLGTAYLQTAFPKIHFTGQSSLQGLQGLNGMVPQEMGTLTTLKAPGAQFKKLGMPYENDPTAQKTGLPEAMNSLEVTNVSDPSVGRSLFFVDLVGNVEGGSAPTQFTLGPDAIVGFWVTQIKGQKQLALPAFGIGVADRDFRPSVDSYVSRHAAQWANVNTPTWLSEAGAIYTFSGGGAGGIYLALPPAPKEVIPLTSYAAQTPCRDIETMGFQCVLQRMLQEAHAVGTNVIYLYDYWEAVSSPILTCPGVTAANFYLCKGDYFIREDLGGMASLHAGIDEVHHTLDAHGVPGRVILYLEPFVVHEKSAVGNAHGELWGGRFPGEDVWVPFPPDGIAMSQANGEWQQYVVQKAADLVRQTGADGIFLDSAGWRLGLPVETKQEVVLNSPLENAMGVLNLADRVRTAIQAISPNHDAVVLSENTAGPMWRHVDGGVSADFNPSGGGFTGVDTLGGRLLTSPIRYATPQINVFSNGTDLNELNQVFAVGHNLALCTNWGSTWMQANAAYIQTLVQARKDLAPALVHGSQISQLDVPGDQGSVVVYSYTGSPNVVNVLNAGTTAFRGTIPIHALMQPNTIWRDRLNGDLFAVTVGGLNISVPGVPAVTPQCAASGGLVGCTQQCGPSGSCGLRVLEQTGTL
jgi:hypothetical protein